VYGFEVLGHHRTNGIFTRWFFKKRIMKLFSESYAKILGAVMAAFFLLIENAGAQAPQNLPNENYVIDWSSWTDIVLFVILPVILVILFIFRKKLIIRK